mgnify:CR=1 FL=1
MRNRKEDLPTLKVKNIGPYLDSIRDAANKHFICLPDGSKFYCIGGKMIPEKDFFMPMATLQRNITDKGFLLDGRSNWIE